MGDFLAGAYRSIAGWCWPVSAALASAGSDAHRSGALWVALVDFLPQVGGALAGIPTVLFALGHSLTAGIVTAVVFVAYQQVENHVLNPVIMSRTVRVNPLLILVSVLIGASIGDWVGGFFGSFVAALISIPAAGTIQILTKEIWQATGPGGPLDDEPAGTHTAQ